MSFSSSAQELVSSSRPNEFLSYNPKSKTLYTSSEESRDYAIRYIKAFDNYIRLVTGKYKREGTDSYIYCICCIQEALDDCRWERIRYFLAKVENRDLVYLVLGFTPDEGTSQEDLCIIPKVNRVRQITSVPMITPKTSTMSSASMSGFATIASITMQS